jgi:hypothetical protein
MKKNVLIVLILAGFLIVPTFCLAQNYNRIPSGSPITSPVSFDVEIDICKIYLTQEECEAVQPPCYWYDTFCQDASLGIILSWNLYFQSPEETQSEDCVDISENSHLFIENFEVGKNFNEVGLYGWTGADCTGDIEFQPVLEGLPGFSIIAGGGSIFTLPPDAVASTTGFIGDLFGAVGPFIWLFIGVPLGFVVIERIKKVMPKEEKNKKDDWFEKEEKEFQKVSKLVKEKKAEGVGEWLGDWRKGKIKF